MKYKIFCTDGFAQVGREELEKDGLCEVTYVEKLDHEELVARIGSFDGLVVRSASKVSSDVIEAGANLKIIARAGAGVDNIDREAATQRGILVVNAPAGNTNAVTELTFGFLLSLARHIPQASRSMHEGKWEKKKYNGTEIAYKTLGVIGLGRVGQAISHRAKAFDMEVIAYDPYVSKDVFVTLGVKEASLEEIYKNADFITIHAPKSKETNDLITAKELKMMKPSAYIVNCARGGMVNEADLAAALKNNVIAGAAIDVYTKEPFENSMYRDLENCVTTPHLGASTDEAQDAVAVETAVAIKQFIREGRSDNAVNKIK